VTYFSYTVSRLVADSHVTADGKAHALRKVRLQALDLLRAAGPAELDERERDVEEIDQALAILFPSHTRATNAS
jgi:hypothetical protein